MLRTNSKKVRDAVRAYITSSVLDYVKEQYSYIKSNPSDNYLKKAEIDAIEEVHNLFQNISDKKEKELQSACCKLPLIVCAIEVGGNSFKDFEYWMSEINGVIDCSYYLCKGKKLLQQWLEQSDKEADKFSEIDAEKLITSLIYRELTK